MSELLTVAEVAALLRVDATTVRRWIKQGTVKATKAPLQSGYRALHIKRETVDHLLGNSKEQVS